MKENLDDVLNAHNNAVRIERLTHNIERIRDGLDEVRRGQDDLRTSMKQMADALTRLTLVEERQTTTSSAIERLSGSIERLEERLRKLEISEPLQARSSEWIMNACGQQPRPSRWSGRGRRLSRLTCLAGRT